MQKTYFILILFCFLLIPVCASAQNLDVPQASAAPVQYRDEAGNPVDPRCIIREGDKLYIDDELCGSIGKAKDKNRWREGFMIRADLGGFAGTQAVSTGYRAFDVPTAGFSGQLDFGYHWREVGIFAQINFNPGTTSGKSFRSPAVGKSYTEGCTKEAYNDYCNYYYDPLKSNWNRTIGGFGGHLSFYIPVDFKQVVNFDVGLRFLFGKATDNKHVQNEFNMYVAIGYLYFLDDHFSLGLNFKMPGLISYATVNTFNKKGDVSSQHIFMSLFYEANLSFGYSF